MSLDPQAQNLLDKVKQAGIPTYDAMEPAIARQFYEKACELAQGVPPQLYNVETIGIPGPASELSAVCYRPSATEKLPVLVYFHGGGFTIGSPRSHDGVCRQLCMEAGCIVISVDYRLAPEHRFPAAVDDAYAATCWVADNAHALGGDPARIAVGGDSAGGNLAAVVCLLAKQSGGPRLVHQLLIYPDVDMTGSFPSRREFAAGYLLTATLIQWFHDHYLGEDADIIHWKSSPFHADDHSALPPAFILTAGFDPLQDEARAYGEKLAQAGVSVNYSHYAGMLHGFITQTRFIDQAKVALTECAQNLRKAFASSLS